MAERRCGHCGREGTLECVQSVVIDSRDEDVVEPHDMITKAHRQTVIQIDRCRVCGEPTFARYSWVDPFESPGDTRDWTVLYPARHTVADLPDRVGRSYQEMLELLHAPDAFAVRAGKLLEAVCADRGVEEGRLSEQVMELASRGDLPEPLAAQAHLVRRYRNFGGHDEELEVQEDDVPLIRGFVEALLEFLYWGPAKLARGNAELQRRRGVKKSSGLGF